MKKHHLANLLRYTWPYRWKLAWIVLLTGALSILAMLPPLLIRAMIDRVVTQGDRSLFLLLAVLLVLVPATVSLCGFIQTTVLTVIGWRFLTDLRCGLYNHMLAMSMRFYGKNSTGMLVNRLMGDTLKVGDLLGGSQTVSTMADLICATFALSATFAINWRLGLLLFLVVGFFALNWQMNIGRLRQAGRSYWSSFDRLSGGIQNRLAANLAIKTFGAEDREQSAYSRQSEESLDLLQGASVAGNTFGMNTSLIQNVGRAVVYFSGCALVLRGDISYGDVMAFTTYAMQLLWPAVRLSEMGRQIQDFRVAVERISEILSENPEITPAKDAVTVPRLRGAVDFDRVSFAYEENRPVIDRFDLHVRAGETIALIGPTGCGKSTILSLLLRFFDVRAGELRLDGIDVRKIDLHCLRRQFGIVLQEPLLFNTSIAENIRYGRAGASLAEIQAAARVAEIHDFILTLPDGYNSVLGNEGVQLSLGQKQRITIARAVVADPAILIMDEATSALDSESEHAIQVAMQRVLRGRTAFIVAHRLSTIRGADRIVVMKRGRIEEIGNHAELMAQPDGHYRELYETFMSKGVLEEDKIGERAAT